MADHDFQLGYGGQRGLTAGEIEMARGVFGSSIDYSRVRINHRSYLWGQSNDITMTPDGNLYCPDGTYQDDFSKANSRHFIHEMTHVWQKQNNVIDPAAEGLRIAISTFGNYQSSYAYKLDSFKDLRDYGLEQQADLVVAYFRLQQREPQKFEPIDYDAREKSFLTMIQLGVLTDKYHKNPNDPRVLRAMQPDEPNRVFFDATGTAHLVRKSVDEQRNDWAAQHRTQGIEDRQLMAVMANFSRDPAYVNKCPVVTEPREDSTLATAGPRTTGMG